MTTTATIVFKVDSDFKPLTPGDAVDFLDVLMLDEDTILAEGPHFWHKFCEETFESGNIGALRDRLPRSMSVGDAILFEFLNTGIQFMATVQGEGWHLIDFSTGREIPLLP